MQALDWTVQKSGSLSKIFWTRLFRIPRYLELIVHSLHLKLTPLFRTCQKQSTRGNSQATNKEWGPSSNRDSLTLQFVCCWGSRDSTANKPVVIHDRQKYKKKTKNNRTFKDFSMQQHLLIYPTYNYCILFKKWFIETNFTLPRLFRNPAISNLFPFPLGLRNSGVQLYNDDNGLLAEYGKSFFNHLCLGYIISCCFGKWVRSHAPRSLLSGGKPSLTTLTDKINNRCL